MQLAIAIRDVGHSAHGTGHQRLLNPLQQHHCHRIYKMHVKGVNLRHWTIMTHMVFQNRKVLHTSDTTHNTTLIELHPSEMTDDRFPSRQIFR